LIFRGFEVVCFLLRTSRPFRVTDVSEREDSSLMLGPVYVEGVGVLRTIVICWLAVAALLVLPVTSQAQSQAPAPDPAAAPAPTPAADDAALNVAQPDYTLVNLPTTRRLQTMKNAFRVTH